MRGDIPEVAFRLLTALPVRTHERKPYVREASLAAGNPYGRRAVIVNGVRYETCREARTKLAIGYDSFYRMLNRGEARYL